MNENLVQTVLNRDNHTCQMCFATDKKLDVHHIIPIRLLGMDIINNLIAVCRYCHRLIEFAKVREMTNKSQARLYKARGSFSLVLKKSFIEDSGCGFEKGDTCYIEMVENNKMIITKITKDDN